MQWLNGSFTDHPQINANDRGFLLGDGVFETFIKKNDVAIFFEEHFQRLLNSLSVLGIEYPYTKDETLNVVSAFPDQMILRLTVSRGYSEGRGLWPAASSAPTVLITSGKLPEDFPDLNVTKVSFPKNEKSPYVSMKTLNYLDEILARKEVLEAGFDDGIFVNTSGFVCEATTSNLFWVKEGKVYTSPMTSGILPGIIRAKLMAFLNVSEENISFENLKKADEIFLTNSVWGIRSVAKIDDIELSSVITKKIRKQFEDAVYSN